MKCFWSSGVDKCPRSASTRAVSVADQRLSSWRGRRPPHAQRPVVRRAGETHDNVFPNDDELGAQGSLESNAEWTSPSPVNASQESENNTTVPKDFVLAALAGMAMESLDGLQSPSSRNNTAYNPEPSDPKGWYECHLFDVLQGAYIDSQTASHFFSELAIIDSVGDELGMDDLLHVARIADITGFTLPPVIAAQLQRLVGAAGPAAATATAEKLLAGFCNDLPALLDTLHAMGITPSTAWTDTAVRAWLASNSGGGDGGGTQLSAADVRAVAVLLEAIYIPNASTSEPTAAAAVEPPRPPPVPYTAIVPQQVYNGTWRSTSSPRTVSTGEGVHGGDADARGGGGEGEGDRLRGGVSLAASVRIWLDACLAALLDGGALALSHQREDLYDMLSHLATAPSAAMVERLYSEAWPPYVGSDGAASPEQIASMLWLVAGSGAKLPPAILQSELRSLETAILRIASADAGGGGGGGDGSRADGRSPNAPAAGNAAGAAAAAALNAAFALPSAPGGGDRSPATPPPSPADSPPPASPPASPPPPPPPSLYSNALFPPPPFMPPPSRSTAAAGGGGGSGGSGGGGSRLSPHSAYLALWAFQHYNYRPHPSAARIIAPALLAAAVGGAGGGVSKRVIYIGGGGGGVAATGGLTPAQRCRVLRAMLTCFSSVPPHLLAPYNLSPLFMGWETLGAAELMPLLQDLGTLARQRRRDGGGGGGVEHFVRLPLLAAHVIQLPGWPHRLAGVGLNAAVNSLASLLAVLGTDGDLEGDTAAAAAAPGGSDADGVAAATGSVDGGGGGGVGDKALKAISASGFAQDVLSTWLAAVLPVIQEGVKQVTGDWGTAGRRLGAAAGGGLQRWEQHQPHHQQRPSAQVADDAVARFVDAVRPWSAVAVATSSADAAAAAGSLTPSWRASPVHGADVAVAAAAAPPPPLTAADLMAALSALRDAAAALDPRVRPELNRTIMWAMQRLGSRAGKCKLEPDAFSSVPAMLVRLDALGWVDMPLEWIQTVVQHPDTEASWFRRLAWPEALRAVLVSGQLVQRARAEVLRRHGAATVAAAAAATAPSLADGGGSLPGQGPSRTEGAVPSSDSFASEQGWLGGHGATAAPPPPPPAPSRPSSKATALLSGAERLRSHLLNLLAVRAAASSGPQLRQLALTWQVYGMPYDRDALASVLGALSGAAAAAAAAAAAGDGGVAAVTHGSVRDAVERLQMMCEAAQVPREEMEGLFAPLWMYGH